MDDLVKIRKYLHQHPEISGKESRTAEFIVEELKKIGVQTIHQGFSQHSVIAAIGDDSAGKTILFRCELDALPIQEANNFKHSSKIEGVAHKCGHDGHMAIMLGLAKALIKNKPKQGKFILLFQSAEETGQGAKAVLESGFLNQFNIDYAVSLHNVPGYPLNSIICKEGVFTPSVESINIELIGRTSHAGEPDKGINPSIAISKIIDYFNSLHQPDMDKSNYFVVAPIHIRMGEEAYGTSAGNANIGYTIRSTEFEFFKTQKGKIEKEIDQIASKHSLEYKINWLESFTANMNNEEVVETIKNSCQTLDLNYINRSTPFDWGEDFGLFTQHFKGAMFGLGSSENAFSLHDDRYDFPDATIPTAVQLFAELAKQLSK
ncbi:MAG: amidohydrolase [Brumimicrobium sp.]